MAEKQHGDFYAHIDALREAGLLGGKAPPAECQVCVSRSGNKRTAPAGDDAAFCPDCPLVKEAKEMVKHG